MIPTISYDQHDIIRWILELHIDNQRFDLDPTYSKGVFYRPDDIPEPMFKADINPIGEGVLAQDVTDMQYNNCIFDSVIFDPPFVTGSKKDGKPGIIKTRFSYLRNQSELWEFYLLAMQEIYRVLKPNGVMVFKCQDQIESSKNYFNHVWIMNEAYKMGFYPKDLFVKLSKHVMNRSNWKQQHARKYHCYFWVFRKTDSKVKYF